MKYKFKADLKNLPKEILHTVDGQPTLRLRFNTSSGVVEFPVTDGQIIETDNLFVKIALENYVPPKIPVRHRPNKNMVHAYYNHNIHKDKNPFSLVDDEEPDHRLNAEKNIGKHEAIS